MINEEYLREYNEYVQGLIAAHNEWLAQCCSVYGGEWRGHDPEYNEFATEEDGSAIIDA